MLLSSLDSLLGLLGLAAFLLKASMLLDCAFRRVELFPAAGKQTKWLWLLLLGLATLWNFVSSNPLGFINLAGLVAALVYLVDVRPALRELGGGGRGGRSKRSSSDW